MCVWAGYHTSILLGIQEFRLLSVVGSLFLLCLLKRSRVVLPPNGLSVLLVLMTVVVFREAPPCYTAAALAKLGLWATAAFLLLSTGGRTVKRALGTVVSSAMGSLQFVPALVMYPDCGSSPSHVPRLWFQP